MTKARTLADMISDGVIGTTELADDVITPVKLDETGNYTMAQLGVNGTVTADGLTVGDNSTSEIPIYFNSSSTDFSIGANGNNFILAQTTGDLDSNQLLTVTSTGSVGIGTSSPSSVLTVNQGGATDYIRLEGPSSGDIAGGLQLYRGSTLRAAFYANPTHDLTILSEVGINFRTNNANRMEIDTSGNVIANSGSLNLVGTNTQIFAASNGDDIQFKFSGVKKAQINNGGLISASDGSAVVPGFRFVDDPNTGMYRSASDTISFSTAASERIRIRSDGNIHINTTTPDLVGNTTSLSIGGSSFGGDGMLSLQSGWGGTTYGRVFASGGTLKIGNPQNGQVSFYSANATRLNIRGDGDIELMNLQSAAGGVDTNALYWKIQNSANTGQYARLGGIKAETVSAWGGKLKFYTKPANGTPNDTVTEQMVIDQAGRVTMPYQPVAAFGSTVNNANTQRFGASNVYVNIGGHLDTGSNSGRFTCPVAGNYLCTFSGYTNHSSGYGYVSLRKNGLNQGDAVHWNNGNQSHSGVTLNTVLNCAAGNYLEYHLFNANSYVQGARITFQLIS